VSLLARVLRRCIRLYQKVPRMRPPVCRFDPTCSDYALEAVQVHGGVKGLWLATRRVGRCHPWGSMGWDPVPPRDRSPSSEAISLNPPVVISDV
jgi:putative membrane protein insertion efficiency factor